MKKAIRRILSLVLVTLIVIGATPMSASASFITDVKDFFTSRKDSFSFNYRDVDFTVESPNAENAVAVAANGAKAISATTALPSSYSSVTNGKVTAVKNQGNYGTCWAFSATSDCESSLIENASSTQDLSELQLAYYFYNTKKDPLGNATGDKTEALTDSCLDQGGNHLFTMWGLVGWTNGATESTLSYSSANCTAAVNGTLSDSYANDYDIGHVQNAFILPYGTGTTERNNIKQAIVDYGGVACSYYHNSSYYNSSKGSYYTTATGTNHAVTIVGWNDSYSRNNFTKRPSGSGAWLVKNSWGTDWGTDGDANASNSGKQGYFWISYYDASLKSSGKVFVFDFDNAEEYQYNYQYDGSCGIQTKSISAGNTLCATYTVKGTNSAYESINAVGFGVSSTNASGTIYVYSAPTNGNPIGGSLLTSQSFKTTYAGYYTFDLNEAPLVAAGTDYTVAVKFTNAATVFVDYSYTNGDWIRFTADTANDRTYLINGSAVTDLKNSGMTARLKAYTQDAGTPRASYEVTYNGQGGSNVPAAQIKYEGEDLVLSSVIPTLAGYNFIGWATYAGGAVEYLAGATYSADAPLALYAVWEKKIAAFLSLDKPNVSLDVGGDSVTVTAIANPSDTILDLSIKNAVGSTYTVDGITVTQSGANTFTVKATALPQETVSFTVVDNNSGLEATCTVSAQYKKATSVSVSPSNLSLTVEGDSSDVTVSCSPSDAVCEWEIVGAVSSGSAYTYNGLTIVKGTDNTYHIAATSYVSSSVTLTFKEVRSQKTATCTVNVKDKPKLADSISISDETAEITVGGASKTVTLYADPSDATVDFAVDSISESGVSVTAGANNTFTIKATSFVSSSVTVTFIERNSGKKVSCVLTVKQVTKSMSVSAKVEKQSKKVLGIFSKTSYVATITATPTGTTVAKVEYSTNSGKTWKTGTSFTSSSQIKSFLIRVTDADGTVYNYSYSNGTVTKK